MYVKKIYDKLKKSKKKVKESFITSIFWLCFYYWFGYFFHVVQRNNSLSIFLLKQNISRYLKLNIKTQDQMIYIFTNALTFDLFVNLRVSMRTILFRKSTSFFNEIIFYYMDLLVSIRTNFIC